MKLINTLNVTFCAHFRASCIIFLKTFENIWLIHRLVDTSTGTLAREIILAAARVVSDLETVTVF